MGVSHGLKGGPAPPARLAAGPLAPPSRGLASPRLAEALAYPRESLGAGCGARGAVAGLPEARPPYVRGN